MTIVSPPSPTSQEPRAGRIFWSNSPIQTAVWRQRLTLEEVERLARSQSLEASSSPSLEAQTVSSLLGHISIVSAANTQKPVENAEQDKLITPLSDTVFSEAEERLKRREALWSLWRLSKAALPGWQRLQLCGSPIPGRKVEVISQDGVGFITGLYQCGLSACARCYAMKAFKRRAELVQVAGIVSAQKLGMTIVTQTTQHGRFDSFAEVFAKLERGYQSVWWDRSRSRWQSALPEIVGRITALEVRDGKKGYHPHYHTILLTAQPVSSQQATAAGEALKASQAALSRRHGLNLAENRAIDFRPVVESQDAGEEVARYLVKAGAYVSKPVTLEERRAGGSLDLAQLLTGSPEEVSRWVEIQTHLKGKKLLRYSPGLRKKLALAALEVDDEKPLQFEIKPESPRLEVTHLWPEIEKKHLQAQVEYLASLPGHRLTLQDVERLTKS